MAKGRYRHGAESGSAMPPTPPVPPPVVASPEWDPWYHERDRPREGPLRYALLTVGALVALALLVLMFPAFIVAMSNSHTEMREPQTFDDPLVRNTADLACEALDDDLERIPRASLTAPAARRRAAIDAENVAIARLVDRMRALGPERLAADPPAEGWIADWEALVAAREAYVASLGRGERARFEVPRDHEGRPVMERMDDAACAVPTRLLLLPPETALA